MTIQLLIVFSVEEISLPLFSYDLIVGAVTKLFFRVTKNRVALQYERQSPGGLSTAQNSHCRKASNAVLVTYSCAVGSGDSVICSGNLNFLRSLFNLEIYI